MTSRWNPLVAGGCNVLGVALLAMSVAAGGSVRAAGDATLDGAVVESLMKFSDVLQQRMAKIEASAVAAAQSLTTRRIATHELCMVDERGAQTCVTKVQLDALLKGAEQIKAAVPAATPAGPRPIPQPVQTTESRPSEPACRERCVAPEAPVAAAAPSQTPHAGAATQPAPAE
jgi:hypothetical protein